MTVQRTKAGWPKEVPVLGDNDIRKYGMGSGGWDQSHCLLGWVNVTFYNSACPYAAPRVSFLEQKKRLVILGFVKKCLSDEILGHDCGTCTGKDNRIARFNDARSTPLGEVAKVWNKAMARLGYTVGNPEAS